MIFSVKKVSFPAKTAGGFEKNCRMGGAPPHVSQNYGKPWDPFSYNLFTKYSTNEEDEQNQKLSFFISFLKFEYHIYIIGWIILRKVYSTEREVGVTEKRRKKKGSLVLVSTT